MIIEIPKGKKRFYLKGQIDTFVYRSHVDTKTRADAINHYLKKHYMTRGGVVTREWIDAHLLEDYT